MEHKELDKEYYVMSVGGSNNYPLLSWGRTNYLPFIMEEPIEERDLKLPLEILFDTPYPQKYEMADFLSLNAQYAVSERLKNLFEKNNIYGVQFFPIEIKSNKGDTILEHYAMHFWNRLAAIDKKNYVGKMDRIGLIMDLGKFSLNEKLLNEIPFEQRKAIRLSEEPTMLLVHETIYEAIKTEELTGITFCRVDEWDEGAMFR